MRNLVVSVTTHFKITRIMTNNIISGHIKDIKSINKFLGTLCNF